MHGFGLWEEAGPLRENQHMHGKEHGNSTQKSTSRVQTTFSLWDEGANQHSTMQAATNYIFIGNKRKKDLTSPLKLNFLSILMNLKQLPGSFYTAQ